MNENKMDINIEVLNSNGYFFKDSRAYDVLFFTSCNYQRLLFGTQSNNNCIMMIDSNSVTFKRDLVTDCNMNFHGDFVMITNCNPYPVDTDKSLYLRYSTYNGEDAAYIKSIQRVSDTDVNLDMYLQASNIYFVTGDTTSYVRAVVRTDGAFGIGTSNPTELLDVDGNIQTRSNIIMFSNQAIIFGSNVGTGFAGRMGYGLFNSNSLDLIGAATPTQTGRYITFHINSNQGGGNIGRALFHGGNVLLNTGNLALGSSNPLAQLHIAKQNTTSNNILIDSTVDGFSAINFNGYYAGTDQRLNTGKQRWRFYVDQRTTKDYMNFDSYDGSQIYNYMTFSNGYIGINEQDPSAKLNIKGSTVQQGADGTQSYNNPLTLEDTSGQAMRIVHLSTSVTDSTIYNYQQSKNVYWGEQTDTGGFYFRGKNVSVGNSNPDKKLTIGSGSTDTISAIKLNTGDADKIYLTNSNNGSKITHSNNFTIQIQAGQSNQYNGAITFTTGSNTGYQERMRVDTNGYIGISTNLPQERLHVNGSVQLGGSNGNGLLWTAINGDSASFRFYSQTDATSYLEIKTSNEGTEPIVFKQNSTERLRIHENGYVGIGTNNPSTPLEVSGTITCTQLSTPLFNATNISGTTITGDTVNATTSLQTSSTDRIDIQGNLLNIPNLVGIVLPFAGSSAPTGWLLCFGQSLDTTTYADLFNVIGYTYGGSGTSFNVPDMRGRVAVGKDNMGGSAANRMSIISGNILGSTGGLDKVTLNSNECGVAPHTHNVIDPGHTHTGSSASHTHTMTDPGHTHGGLIGITTNSTSLGLTNVNIASNVEIKVTNSATTGVTAQGTAASVSIQSRVTQITLSNALPQNATAAHTNTQPSIILNYIIKY